MYPSPYGNYCKLLLAAIGIFLFLSCLGLAKAQTNLPEVSHKNLVILDHAQVALQLPTSALEKTVDLPYHWDRQHPGTQGAALFTTEFSLRELPTGPHAIYVTKIGNAFTVKLNGVRLFQEGEIARFGTSDYSKVPRIFTFPGELLRPHNVLSVEIRADIGRRSGLSKITIGPLQEVRDLYFTDYRWRGTGTLMVVTFSLLLAGIAFSIWVTQRRQGTNEILARDRMYLFAAMAELSWSLRISDALIESPPMLWSLWSGATVLALAAWNYFMVAFCIEVMQWQEDIWANRLLRLLRAVTALSLPGGVLAIIIGKPLLVTAVYFFLAIFSAAFILYMFWSALQRAQLDGKLVASASVVNLVVGIYDLAAFRFSDALAQNTYMRYSSVLFGLALGYTLIRRFQEASRTAHLFTRDLSDRVKQKEAELKISYNKLERLVREQEREAERARVLRDLHDGVGSQISMAIRQIEFGSVTPKELLLTLRESMDFLKLSIDSMGITAGDINGLLASFRYRLEPRIKAGGLQLLWEVDELPHVSHFDGNAMRHLLFIFYEACSNVLQHAQATTLTIKAQSSTEAIHIIIMDNGIGIANAGIANTDMKTIRDRVMLIGAKLDIASNNPGTKLQISLYPHLLAA